MFPKHHFVVRKIEESTDKIFSVIRGIGCDLPKTDSGKITCLYFDKVHNSQEYREIVYKTINGFILHYERGGGPTYTMDIYFYPEQTTDVNFFIKSLTTKKNTNI
jgi:hypothetical protein